MSLRHGEVPVFVVAHLSLCIISIYFVTDFQSGHAERWLKIFMGEQMLSYMYFEGHIIFGVSTEVRKWIMVL
jgi:hypothetical protein